MDGLLSEIDAFLEAHGVAETRFGRDSVNDARLIADLREGRELRRATIERVRLFMLTYRPEREAA